MYDTYPWTDIQREEDAPPDELNLQNLINSGTWGLEGSMGRAMWAAIENGDAILGKEDCKDYWGNHIPSRFQVEEGTLGSVSYANNMREKRGLDPLTEAEFDEGRGLQEDY